MISYTLLENPGGFFRIVGNKIQAINSPIPEGNYNYTVRAIDDNGWIKNYTGTINVAIGGVWSFDNGQTVRRQDGGIWRRV